MALHSVKRLPNLTPYRRPKIAYDDVIAVDARGMKGALTSCPQAINELERYHEAVCMKGTMSELELSLLRARSMEALKQKARRGELFFTVAVGYVKVGRDKIEMDPDLRVREAIGLVFTRFAEMQSIRQVFLSLRGDQIALPSINSKSSGQHQLLWKLPVYATVNNLLTNPVYAGAYAFGRTGSWVMIENGRKRILRGYRKNSLRLGGLARQPS